MKVKYGFNVWKPCKGSGYPDVIRMEICDGRAFVNPELKNHRFGEPQIEASHHDMEELNLIIMEFCDNYGLVPV